MAIRPTGSVSCPISAIAFPSRPTSARVRSLLPSLRQALNRPRRVLGADLPAPGELEDRSSIAVACDATPCCRKRYRRVRLPKAAPICQPPHPSELLDVLRLEPDHSSAAYQRLRERTQMNSSRRDGWQRRARQTRVITTVCLAAVIRHDLDQATVQFCQGWGRGLEFLRLLHVTYRKSSVLPLGRSLLRTCARYRRGRQDCSVGVAVEHCAD